MYSLYEVCVSESSSIASFRNNRSPNAYFTTECGTIKVPIDIKNIRFGSLGDPLNGLTVKWESGGTSDSIAWGYTRNMKEGVYHALMRDGLVGTTFDYTFPLLKAASTIHYSIFDSYNSI